MLSQVRNIARTVRSTRQAEGKGAVVRRSIGSPECPHLDPFLLLDEFELSPPAGFPDHPHRGFETVTYMLTGAVKHEDFKGHSGTIYEGDLQWMTAGKGIVHSEMPAIKEESRGLQLWVNLPIKDKFCEPRYQELKSYDIPQTEKDGISVKVISGEAFGLTSTVYTRTPTLFLDFHMEPKTILNQPIPEQYQGFVYTLDGKACYAPNESETEAHCTLILAPNGDHITVKTLDSPARFVLIAGQPLNEPVVQHGSFVMSSHQEILQTIEDFRHSKNGFENAHNWRMLKK